MRFYSQEASMRSVQFLVATLAVYSNLQEVCRLQRKLGSDLKHLDLHAFIMAKYEAKGWRVNSMLLMQLLSVYLLSKLQFKQISLKDACSEESYELLTPVVPIMAWKKESQ